MTIQTLLIIHTLFNIQTLLTHNSNTNHNSNPSHNLNTIHKSNIIHKSSNTYQRLNMSFINHLESYRDNDKFEILKYNYYLNVIKSRWLCESNCYFVNDNDKTKSSWKTNQKVSWYFVFLLKINWILEKAKDVRLFTHYDKAMLLFLINHIWNMVFSKEH